MNVFLFDIDGTLIVSGGAGQLALRSAMREAFAIDDASEVEVHGCTDRGIARSLFLTHGLADTSENWNRFRTVYLSGLPRYLRQRQGRVLPGVAELLDRLAGRPDVAVGLLTGNIREGARIKLEYYQLMHHFAFGGFGDVHPDRDDVARAALADAHRHLNGSLVEQKVWVIGDTPNDIRCARAVGVRVAAVATGFSSAVELAALKPDLLLDDLSDANQFLSRIASVA